MTKPHFPYFPRFPRFSQLLHPARSVIFTLGMVALLLDLPAHAENPQAAASAPSASAAEGETAVPRYSPQNLERAFKFMDSNGDGQLTRDEASRFRGVTKYFDRADTDGDGMLSREEFDKAMNYVKPGKD